MEKKDKHMKRSRLIELLETLATKEGSFPSPLETVRFMRANHSTPRAPIVYEPSIIIVAQGRKQVYLGDQAYTYDSQNYLVLSVPLPLECETQATPQEPLLGMAIRVDPMILGELLMEMDDDIEVLGTVRGVYSTALSDELTGAAIRLLECLKSPVDSRILGPQIVREITYRVLCGEQGGALRALMARHSHFSQIAKVLNRIHQEYEKSIDIQTLAKDANMSVSTFHHNFKAVTSTSPLQYLKSIRLHKARMIMAHDGLNASDAAYQVGYLSASQFSREFKQFFGNSPADEARRMREMAN